MKFENILQLLAGLALFLYGMKMMSDGLEVAAGNRMKMILEKLTCNRFIGVLVGAGITALIQSSSATTVMVVGFVNSGLMTLTQAIWIIMGANIGTTITGQLLTLDLTTIAPLLAITGVVMVTFFKKKNVQYIGSIIAGLGILFIGMQYMSSSMVPLRHNEDFINLMASFSNPVLGILAGAVFTAVIQSSSASIGILQSLAKSGVVNLHNSAFVLFGQNIGTCITAFLASLSANRNAKRTTIVHLLFNLIGTTLFIALFMLTPIESFIISLSPDSTASQIANLYTIFNIITALCLIPFGEKLANLAIKLLPVQDSEHSAKMEVAFITDHNIGSTTLAIGQLQKEIIRMFKITSENIQLCFEYISTKENDLYNKIKENEKYIDYLNIEITKYLGNITSIDMNIEDGNLCNSFFKTSTDLERMGDHVINITDYINELNNEQIDFSEETYKELEKLKDLLINSLNTLTKEMHEEEFDTLVQLENDVDIYTLKYRNNQIKRLTNKSCDAKACIVYSEMLTDIERISDHIFNIAQSAHTNPAYLVK